MSLLPLDELPWRQGRKVGRTIYAQVGAEPSDDDQLIGLMDTEYLAEMACFAHNRAITEPPPNVRPSSLRGGHIRSHVRSTS